jgi:uncharacterized protein YdeI (YjbR/CyaY-like superfamily)
MVESERLGPRPLLGCVRPVVLGEDEDSDAHRPNVLRREPYDFSERRQAAHTGEDRKLNVTGIPPSASHHPAKWKFDLPIYHPADLAAWRAWLEANHGTARGAWVATWRKPSGRDPVPYPDLVEEAICFGWIDSTVNTLDDERALQLMTPRKAKSGWTRLNKQRVAALQAQGRMSDAGRRAVEVAKANGWWTIYDPVEDMIEPDDLAEALDASSPARTAWDAFPPSARKQMLWWVVSAGKPETRARRITKIVAEAQDGRRAVG